MSGPPRLSEHWSGREGGMKGAMPLCPGFIRRSAIDPLRLSVRARQCAFDTHRRSTRIDLAAAIKLILVL